MKTLYYAFIVCFAFVLSNAAEAVLPFTPSTDTGNGAVWYRIKNKRNSDGGYASYLKAVDTNSAVVQDYPDNTDNFLWCFVGSEAAGFQIHNKALLADGARLVTEGSTSSAVIKVVPSAATWNYKWTFASSGSSAYSICPLGFLINGEQRYLHAQENKTTTIFYNASDYGSQWIFEDGSIPITVDLSALKKLIATCTAQLSADKSDTEKAKKFAKAIAIYEAAIAAAQAVADNPASTYLDGAAAMEALNTAKSNYALGTVDLPITVSEDGIMYWHHIMNTSRQMYGFLTYNMACWENTPSLKTESQLPSDERDAQLWAFVGDNVTGFDIYNKALMENGKLVYENGAFKMTSSEEGGAPMWKLEHRVIENLDFRSIRHADMEGSNVYFRSDVGGKMIIYGFNDSGSKWTFTYHSQSASSISAPSLVAAPGDISVYSRDGFVYMNGTDGKAAIISLIGKVAFFDAEKPYRPENPGIYIVWVNGKAHKVAVK